ncbi:MAG: type I-U CRISPR-associated protein Cas7 [Vicinamibacterales bacterium]
MAKALTLDTLKEAVTGTAAAFRSRNALQPAGGEGTKVFPPTYAGAVYATEKRRLPGHDQPVDCVLLDSVQSQANRMEEALQQAVDTGRFKNAGVSIPMIDVDFTPYWDPAKTNKGLTDDMRLLEPVGRISSLQAPHRIADAILRDSVVTKDARDQALGTPVPFRQSEFGARISMVSSRNATALFELCPTALIFGMWDSTGPKGGLGVKFERAMVAEIVGINAVYGVKTSSRIDPLAIQRDAGPLYRRRDGGYGYTVDPSLAVDELKDKKPTGKKLLYKPNSKGADVYHDPRESKYADQGRPSEGNHGNVTPDIDYRRDRNKNPIKDREGNQIPVGGATIDRAEQTIVLSLPALRRLRFPINGGFDSKVDQAARTVLVALGLCSAALAAEAGLDLRSRCLLWPDADMTWTLLDRKNGGDFTLSADMAIDLLKKAVDEASNANLPWRKEPLILMPSDDLVKLVVKSQRLAMQQQGGDSGDGGE